ncbi:FMN-binding protein [Streptomyces sp. CdTB01]|uniref:FMN-binding protein n=1 Tax=Streptomyces sp. CdTB01 TaxID=1725411 RepID=UPI00073A8242|nr:FMN-binding protein [Streptomyces sp. CdTB01]ALV36831.1 FMN-binding protein [Streptomyces sp. CdTB01]
MKKSHPVRRVVLATAATVSGVVLLLSLKPASDPNAQAAGAAPQATQAAQESPQGGSSATGNGTIDGNVVQTEYGNVQVRLTVANGKITKAEAIQAPKGGTSDQKTALSIPKLAQETVAAQSAKIDSVSGATYTSNGYKQSLQSALDKMKSSAGSSRSGASPSQGAGAPSQGGGGSGSQAGGSGSSGAAQAKTVTGAAAQTQYGPVQVRITVSNGKITKAEAVQAPKGGLSDQKTALAVPKLNQEAVAAGSAKIDSVSGATYTSGGYKQSLQSALDQAGG